MCSCRVVHQIKKNVTGITSIVNHNKFSFALEPIWFSDFSTIVSFWPRQMTGEARGNFNEFVAVPPIFWIHQSLFYLWIMWKVRNLLKNSFNSLTLYHTTSYHILAPLNMLGLWIYFYHKSSVGYMICIEIS